MKRKIILRRVRNIGKNTCGRGPQLRHSCGFGQNFSKKRPLFYNEQILYFSFVKNFEPQLRFQTRILRNYANYRGLNTKPYILNNNNIVRVTKPRKDIVKSKFQCPLKCCPKLCNSMKDVIAHVKKSQGI